MAETPKTLRHLLLAEIHRLTVTRADVDGANALSLDRSLCEAAGFTAFEKLEVTNATNGARFSASLVMTEPNSGTLSIDGAGAHVVRPGDIVTVSAYGWLKEKAALKHHPRRVTVDAQNSITSVTEPPGPPPKKSKKKEA